MNSVLIVSGDKDLVESIQSGVAAKLRRMNFDVYFSRAESGIKAEKILNAGPMDIVVADLDLSEMDGFDLLVFLNNHHPYVPVIVMSSAATPELETKLEAIGTLQLMSKPVVAEELAYLIKDGLELSAPDKKHHCVTVGSLIHLLELEKASCVLQVMQNGDDIGYMYFYDGELYDAEIGDRSGGDAVLELISFEDVRLNLKKAPQERVPRRLETPFLSLLLEALKFKTETLEALRRKGGGEDSIFRKDGAAGAPAATDWKNRPDADVLEKNIRTAKLYNMLRGMSEKIEGAIALQIIGNGGVKVASCNPSGVKVDAFMAKHGMVIRLIELSVKDVSGLGGLEEHIIQTRHAVSLTRRLFDAYYLTVMAAEGAAPEDLRRVIAAYADNLKATLT